MKFVYAIVVSVVFAACGPSRYFSYDTRPAFGNPNVITNDSVSAVATLERDRIVLQVTNKLGSPVKVEWNDASIVLGGRALRVVHSGIRYGDFEKSMLPTVVPPRATIEDYVVNPASVHPVGDGQWWYFGVLPKFDLGKQAAFSYNLSLAGDTLSFFLPLSISGSEHFYRFQWAIDSVNYRDAHIRDLH